MNWLADFPSKHDAQRAPDTSPAQPRPAICPGVVPCGDKPGDWCGVCPKRGGGVAEVDPRFAAAHYMDGRDLHAHGVKEVPNVAA